MELKSCPFCGSDDIFRTQSLRNEIYNVFCANCRYNGPKDFNKDATEIKWNDRTGER